MFLFPIFRMKVITLEHKKGIEHFHAKCSRVTETVPRELQRLVVHSSHFSWKYSTYCRHVKGFQTFCSIGERSLDAFLTTSVSLGPDHPPWLNSTPTLMQPWQGKFHFLFLSLLIFFWAFSLHFEALPSIWNPTFDRLVIAASATLNGNQTLQ